MEKNRITIGQKIPSVLVKYFDGKNIEETNTENLFKGKNVFFFGVPGAFTPTCTLKHLASFLVNYDKIKEKGIDSIICVAVNDIFVLQAWAKANSAENKIIFIADGNAAMTKEMGLAFDASNFGFGTRSMRFSMIVKDGTVTEIQIDENPGECDVSSAVSMLKMI